MPARTADTVAIRRVLTALTTAGQDWHALVVKALDASMAHTGASAAAVFTPGAEGSVDLVALRGEGADASAAWLSAAARSIPDVLRRNDTAVTGEDGAGFVVLSPVALRERSVAVLALYLADTDLLGAEEQRERALLASSILTGADLHAAAEGRASELARLSSALGAVRAAAGAARFKASAIALCNTLAAEFGCERVTLGWVRAHQARTIAMSHAEKIVRRLPLLRDIESAMEEALDQDEDVVFPSGAGARTITRAAEQLSKQHGPLSVVTVPLRVGESLVGAITLERSADRAWSVQEVASLRMVADLTAPMLLHHKRDDAWLGAKLLESARRTGAMAVGPRHTIAKLVALLAVAMLALLIFVRVDHTVPASFVFEASGQRVVSAPMDAVLIETPVRPGDPIVRGETVLARFETTDLRLEASATRAERAAQERRATSARRSGDATTAAIHDALVDEADARLDLIDARIEAATIRAPIDGVVLSGSPERLIGARLQQGEELYRVAPRGGMLAEVLVPQRLISTVEVGQTILLAPTAFPDRRVEAVVARIAPATDASAPRGAFRVTADVSEDAVWMRTGMEGEARVSVGRRSLLSAWTSDLVDWVRLKLWV